MLAFVGPYPEGMEIRHLDGNPENNALENLKYGTRSQNIQDQIRHGVHHFKSKTHCKHGHPYDEANTYYCSRGWRQCRQCKRDWRAQRMLAAAGVPLLSEAS
jgi:hypothetical protein